MTESFYSEVFAYIISVSIVGAILVVLFVVSEADEGPKTVYHRASSKPLTSLAHLRRQQLEADLRMQATVESMFRAEYARKAASASNSPSVNAASPSSSSSFSKRRGVSLATLDLASPSMDDAEFTGEFGNEAVAQHRHSRPSMKEVTPRSQKNLKLVVLNPRTPPEIRAALLRRLQAERAAVFEGKVEPSVAAPPVQVPVVPASPSAVRV